MTTTSKRLCTISLSGAASDLIAPTGAKNVIQAATLTNTSGSAVAVTLWLPAGGAAGATNLVLSAKSVAAGASYIVQEILGQTIEAGAALQGLASVAGVVTLVCSGLEIS